MIAGCRPRLAFVLFVASCGPVSTEPLLDVEDDAAGWGSLDEPPACTWVDASGLPAEVGVALSYCWQIVDWKDIDGDGRDDYLLGSTWVTGRCGSGGCDYVLLASSRSYDVIFASWGLDCWIASDSADASPSIDCEHRTYDQVYSVVARSRFGFDPALGEARLREEPTFLEELDEVARCPYEHVTLRDVVLYAYPAPNLRVMAPDPAPATPREDAYSEYLPMRIVPHRVAAMPSVGRLRQGASIYPLKVGVILEENDYFDAPDYPSERKWIMVGAPGDDGTQRLEPGARRELDYGWLRLNDTACSPEASYENRACSHVETSSSTELYPVPNSNGDIPAMGPPLPDGTPGWNGGATFDASGREWRWFGSEANERRGWIRAENVRCRPDPVQ